MLNSLIDGKFSDEHNSTIGVEFG
jgi:small GTP-binding protein